MNPYKLPEKYTLEDVGCMTSPSMEKLKSERMEKKRANPFPLSYNRVINMYHEGYVVITMSIITEMGSSNTPMSI